MSDWITVWVTAQTVFSAATRMSVPRSKLETEWLVSLKAIFDRLVCAAKSY
ncbi:hypothetical protein SAMN06266787_1354 [Halorubrum ezzemoulense]|jgi:hypothetical protein|uniref:Uncharacterized protein n=1 Tax=Halorubrum ezzemoulense TaxID=337243 RepID=A0A238Z9B1_HALEZ|nr:hypothetical protein SAMN06266787_1354 [Halorubrum ezzemoulense]